MKFLLHAAALNSDDATLMSIDRLVDRIADEIHRVDVPEADLLQESLWYQSARQARQKVLLAAVKRPPRKAAVTRGPHAKVVEIEDPESARLAEKIAHTPLVILVENRESDGVLLGIIVEELGWDELRSLWRRALEVTPPGIEIDSAGGSGEIPVRVSRAISDAAQAQRRVRHFVLMDSDRRWPTDNDGIESVNEAVNICTANGVPIHVWHKRCAENYIPDQVFIAVRDDPRNQSNFDRFNALLRLSSAQRDHFPLKDGLAAGERERGIAIGFYKASDVEDLKLLEDRLLPRRPRPLLLLHQERRASFTAQGLRERDGESALDGKGELDDLLHAIAQEL